MSLQIIEPRLAFASVFATGKTLQDGEKDQDTFFCAKRYGYDAEFTIKAIVDPTSPLSDGIEIVLNETEGMRRRLSIFIPADGDKQVEVSETMISRIPIIHNNNENEE